MDFNQIIALVSPIIVSALTHWIKKIGVVDTTSKPIRTVVLRVIVATLSLGAGIGSYALTGELDQNLVEALVASIGIAAATTIPYLLAKKNKPA